MFKRLGYYLLIVTGLVGISSLSAKADTLDFACGGGNPCTGTVVAGAGNNYSSTGIGGVTSSFEADPFSLVFDTSNGTIQLMESGATDFVGTISSFTPASSGGFTSLNLIVNWTTIPNDVGGNAGTTPLSSVISITSNGSAWSVDVPITTTTVPEPSALMLLAAGLVGLGLLVKFKGALVA